MEILRYNLIKLTKKIKKELDAERFGHTQGVMYIAAALAMAHGGEISEALAAGLLHDCAKCIPNPKKLKLCGKYQIPVSAFELENPFLLHAKLGAYLAKAKYKIWDVEILNAIIWHTTGRPDMTKLEKILYIADYIEPGRDKAPNLEKIRRTAFSDLDECMYQILKNMVAYLKESPKSMDAITEEAYFYYSNQHNSKEE